MSGESKIDRLVRLILLLQQDAAGNALDLARRFGVDRRTIHRYFEDLSGLDVPWYFDEDAQRYRMHNQFFLPPTQLTTAESLSLIALVEQVAGHGQIPLTQPAQLAVEKIRGRLNDRVLAELGHGPSHINIHLAAGSDADPDNLDDVYARVYHAIRHGRKLRCRYDSANTASDGDAWFHFQPYRLWFEQRAWYVVGYHEDRAALRCLKLMRFSGIELTEEPYAIPDDFSIEAYRGHAWRMIRGGQIYDVAIHFDAAVAETVSDTRWHATQSIEDHDDDSITFRCRVDGLDEIKHWVLGYGQWAKVLSPPELADEIAAIAKATAERYGPLS